jgi:hypothetical protein
MSETEDVPGPFYLRWNAGGSLAAQQEESFVTLNAALDAVEARWDTLQHQAPRVFDRRRVLYASTADLCGMMEAEAE